MTRRIGVIGGSGLYRMDGLTVVDEMRLETPFGEPSDAYVLGELDGKPVAFLARHGRGHHLDPAHVPYRANIWGFRCLGVHNLLSVSAVGSLREDVRPLEMMVPNQFVDRTRGRKASFFGDGVAVHMSFAEPVCPELSRLLVEAAREVGVAVHAGGTYVCIEGPQFSTRAESELHRSWGMDVVGMTNLTEAKLAREAEIGYATLAMVCDYDCWHPGHAAVTARIAISNLLASAENAQRVLRGAVSRLPADAGSSCAGALGNAIATHREAIPAAVRQRLGLLLNPYLEHAE